MSWEPHEPSLPVLGLLHLGRRQVWPHNFYDFWLIASLWCDYASSAPGFLPVMAEEEFPGLAWKKIAVSPSMPWTRYAIVRGSDKNVSAGEKQAPTQPHGPVCVG